MEPSAVSTAGELRMPFTPQRRLAAGMQCCANFHFSRPVACSSA